MPKVEIIGMPQSTFVRVVRMVCEEKGIDYELKAVTPHSPEIDAVHPFGKVPGMRHGDLELCESKAIATYLDRTFKGVKVIPEDPRLAAEVEQWVSLVNTHIDPTMIRTYLLNYIFPKGADGKPDRKLIDGALPAMKQQVEVLDRAVAKTGYLVGNGYTLADINLMPILFYVRQFPEGRETIGSAKNLSAYFDRHAQRASFRNTMPPPPPSRQSEPAPASAALHRPA
jgi:glutathione S-transferase